MIGASSAATIFAWLVALLLTAQTVCQPDASDNGACPGSQSGSSLVVEAPMAQASNAASMLQVSKGRAAGEKAHAKDVHNELPANGNTSLTSVSQALNSTALELFERLRQSCERTYPQYGRIWEGADLSPSAVTLDFEFETRAQVRMTPELLLERGGVNKEVTKQIVDEQGLVWPKVSKLFTVGVDGSGGQNANGEWRQSLSAVIELESVVMTPQDAVQGRLAKDMLFFLERLQEKKSITGNVFALPFHGSKGIQVYGKYMRDATTRCSFCGVQWTAGLPLKHVSQLLRLSGDRHWQHVLGKADTLCAQKENGCRPEYHALISLAATVLHKVRACGCDHPKRCMKSWLVRTHFGDLAMHIRDQVGEHEFQSIPADVLEVAELSGSEQMLPNGTVDYLRLPEFAEIAGMVFPRKPWANEIAGASTQDIPTHIDGLLELSERMLQNRSFVSGRLRNRECGLHNGSSPAAVSSFTVKDWLDGVLLGKDLMSDHDSELSKASFSHLMWKSMGNWRMKPGSDRVYLECRRTRLCLAGFTPQKGPSGLIQEVGQRLLDFERDIKATA